VERPIIHNWAEVGMVVYGEVYNDDRRKNGTGIRTSKIVNLDRENGVLTTMNTVYDLGKEYKPKGE